MLCGAYEAGLHRETLITSQSEAMGAVFTGAPYSSPTARGTSSAGSREVHAQRRTLAEQMQRLRGELYDDWNARFLHWRLEVQRSFAPETVTARPSDRRGAVPVV